MKTKHLILITAAMLFMLASLATHAQDVYEYQTVTYTLVLDDNEKIEGTGLYISYSNGQAKKVLIGKGLNASTGKIFRDSSPLLKYVAELSKEGWEVVTAGESDRWYFILKRKVK